MANLHIHLPSPLGWRPSNYKPDVADYYGYEQFRRRLLERPEILRAALMKGGIVWRLATLDVDEDLAMKVILDGPTATASSIGHKFGEQSDDRLTDLMENIICGVYMIDTG
jgi:hypothetical protein